MFQTCQEQVGILKLKEGSFTKPIWLAGMLREKLGNIKNAQILNDDVRTEVRNEGDFIPKVGVVTEESVVVSRVRFLAFIVKVVSGAKQCKNTSDVVRCVVEAADSSNGQN